MEGAAGDGGEDGAERVGHVSPVMLIMREIGDSLGTIPSIDRVGHLLINTHILLQK